MPPSTAFPPGRMKILFFGYFCCFQSISKSLRNVFQNFARDRHRLTLTENDTKPPCFTCLAKEKTPNAPTCATEVDKQKCTELDKQMALPSCEPGRGTQMCEHRSVSTHFPLCNPHPSVSYHFLIKHSCKM